MRRMFTHCRLVSMHTDIEQADGFEVLDNAMIAVENGTVIAVGRGLSIDGFECCSLENRLVTPGLIDAHTHLVFAGNRAKEFEQRLNGASYQDIARAGGGILSTVKATRESSLEHLIELAIPRAKALISDGVTSIEIKSGYGLTVADELKMLRAAKAISEHVDINITTTLLAAHTLPPEYQHSADAYIELVCNEMIPSVAAESLADAVDVFCETMAFTPAQMARVFESALKHGLNIKGHTEQLSNQGGSALAASMGALSVDHIEYLDEIGVKALAEHNTVATLLPGAFYFLRETQKPPIDLLRAHQVPMAVATDFNPGTSPFASLTLMMNMASTLFGLTPKETLYGATRHAAKAAGLHRKGQIAVGFDADFSVWNLGSPAELSYQIGLSPLHSRYLKGVKTHD
ncbi:imidazolonepropionase [Enterovibrio calviensis]|uniref:imidazolonepropionase n=1 Tax=Enterovibrio calviensis TaxID=91359 RepID=UPI0004861B80|nr:imidazolonepropionase [Enterovibrio calviensis]